jgi:hypothetical protein
MGLPDGETCDIVGCHPLEKCQAACTGDGNSSHVTDIEESGLGPDSLIFTKDAGVLDGHVPPGKIDEFGAVSAMLFDKRSLFHD